MVSHHIRGIETSTFDWGWLNKFMQKKHFQCFWECPFWQPEVWITRICSCRNATCKLFDWRPQFQKIDKESFDDLHRCLVRDAEQQSERDFPRMSIRNGISDGTKMCGSKQVGNCFVLLCVIHTHSRKKLMWKEMKDREISFKKFKNCLNCTYHLNVGLMNHICWNPQWLVHT